MSNNEILSIVNNSTGVSIDTRTLKKNNVFFAIKGDNFDGNNFVDKALDFGAKIVIASDKRFVDNDKVILVDDVLFTLQAISNLNRKKYNVPVIAITGTNGKTTTKELLCRILSEKYNVLCTKGNLNNHIGVPLTLLNLKEDHEIAVVEMGASSLGEIKFLCEIANPNFGLITSLGKAHISGFGSFSNIISTKLELFYYLKENNGTFFFNSNVYHIEKEMSGENSVVSFCSDDMQGNLIENLKLIKTYPFLEIEYGFKQNKVLSESTLLYGEYNFNNIVSAYKIADYLQVDSDLIIEQIKNYKPDNNRSQILKWKTNDVILDAYNANPTSMREALLSFIGINKNKNKYLILGDMLELGLDSLDEHLNIFEFIKENNQFEKVILVGKEFHFAKLKAKDIPENFRFFENSILTKTFIENIKITNSLILVKGSRGIKTETIFL